MNDRATTIGVGIASGFAALVVIGGLSCASSTGNHEITGPTADRAEAVAVRAVPGGTAQWVDVTPDGSSGSYLVLVAKPDGTGVAVDLDQDFRVLATRVANLDHDGDIVWPPG